MKKKIELKTTEMGESLFASIIFFVFGIFLITDPQGVIQWILTIFGLFVTLFGVFKLLLYYKAPDNNKKDIINGGAFIILGMSLILCAWLFYGQIKTILRFISAIYLFYVGVNRLVMAFKTKGNKKPYFINAAVIISIAVLLIIIPMVFKLEDSLIFVGILITLYAITEMVGFVFGRKDQPDTKVTEAVVVKEQITTKEEDVKLLEKKGD